MEISNELLVGQTAMITGAGANIGRATAIEFAKMGASIVAVDIDELASAVMKLSDILLEIEEIQEIEINPLLVYEDRAVAVDARVVLQ